jgi:hypothetical protein
LKLEEFGTRRFLCCTQIRENVCLQRSSLGFPEGASNHGTSLVHGFEHLRLKVLNSLRVRIQERKSFGCFGNFVGNRTDLVD